MSKQAIRKSDIPVYDMSTPEETTRALGSTTVQIGHGQAIMDLNNYAQGVAVARLVHGVVGSEPAKQTELVDKYGLNQSQLNKSVTIARVAMALVKPIEECGFTDKQVERLVAQTGKLRRFWKFEHGDTGPIFDQVMVDLFGEDGDKRADALVTLRQTFGAPTGAYNVANGTRFHADDPDQPTKGDESDDESGDDEQDDDSKVSWQDRLSALVAQCKTEGATPAEIIKVVNDTLKGS